MRIEEVIKYETGGERKCNELFVKLMNEMIKAQSILKTQAETL